MLTESVQPFHSVQIDMSAYPNILTPPSSSEDSPQSTLYRSPPSCYQMIENPVLLPQTSLAFDLDAAPQNQQVPYLQIVEQPIDKFRFRYKSEMTGTHGSLCGQNSDRSRKQTYPTVELHNFNKKAIIRCSIYQHNIKDDHKPHAHRLIKKHGKGEVDDPHDVRVSPEDGFTCVFHSMGIIHTAKKNLVPELVRKKTQLKREEVTRLEGRPRELTQKEEIEIKGLAEAESKSINLNVVCLRFDAFFESNGMLLPICPPVFTHAINNLKSALTGELKIVRMDHCTSPAKGGKEVFILVERVTKKNIRIRFYELDDDDTLLWEDYGKFSDLDVHHQYAIVFKTPPYKDLNLKAPVKVFIELERPSDRARSEAKEFTYIPSSSVYKPGAKRARPSYGSSSYDSSLASDELPVPINNLCLENSYDVLDEVNSDELQQALNNINSDEFQKIFADFGAEYSLVTDAPSNFKGRILKPRNVTVRKNNVKNRKEYLSTNSIEDTAFAKQAISELQNFVRTHPTDEKAVSMLRHYLMTENKSNPLHISIRQGEKVDAMFLLKMIYVWKQHDLLNVQNENRETALHIATYLNMEEVVTNLVVCKADASIGDSEINTALHLAVLANASNEIFEMFLSLDSIKSFIDAENNEGNTALDLAIDANNLRAVKLLCTHADINKQHKKNGYTPLRSAIEKQNVDIVKYIFQHKDLNPLIEDFNEINPLHAGLKKENEELLQVISEFMRQNNYADVEIKNEIENMSDEEYEEKFCVKAEPISVDELKELYSGVQNFTVECLDEISEILDKSGTWQNLADLLDLGHLLRAGVGTNSPSRFLLKLAIETKEVSVLEIRELLESLDETQVVEIIDNMVRSQFG